MISPTQKQNLWNALLKLKSQHYVGKRGGWFYLKYQELRELYLKLVYQADSGTPHGIWYTLQKFKDKITPSYIRKIYQYLFGAAYSIEASTLSVAEGQTVTFTFYGADGYYKWVLKVPPGSTFTAQDFEDGADSGSFNVSGGVGSFDRTIKVDAIIEPVETFYIDIQTSETREHVLYSPMIAVPDISQDAFVLEYNNVANVPFAPTDIAQWNTYLAADFNTVYAVACEDPANDHMIIYLKGVTGNFHFIDTTVTQPSQGLIRVIDNTGYMNELSVNNLFYSNDLLQEAYLPNCSVITGNSIFQNCYALTDVTFGEWNPDGTFDKDLFAHIENNTVRFTVQDNPCMTANSGCPVPAMIKLLENNDVVLTIVKDAMRTIAVGEFYKGGWIYAVDSNYAYIVSNFNKITNYTSIHWANGYHLVGANSSTINTQVTNSEVILNFYGQNLTDYAAGYVHNSNYLGYTDWYIPTSLAANAAKANTSFTNCSGPILFWTSTEIDDSNAYGMDTTSGVIPLNKQDNRVCTWKFRQEPIV